MPKRRNEFQRLVEAIHHQLGSGAAVSESCLLEDRVTHQLREVDIVIEATIAESSIRIGIECCDLSRKASVEWVERMCAKARLSCFFLDAHASRSATELLADDSRPSIHDSLLTGYEVDGKKRTIVMHTEPHQGGGEAFVDVIFTGVVAYQFEGDAMGNIIFEIEPASAEVRPDIATVIVAQQRQHGTMPDWNPTSETLEQYCDGVGLTMFRIQSSYGLDGWVIAASMEHRLFALN